MRLRSLSTIKQRINLNKIDTVIIGAGPAGLSAATTLKKRKKDVLILEEKSVVGGKCHTFTDPLNEENKTEWGAVVLTPNYGKVIDKVKEKKLSWESMLSADNSTIPFIKNINKMDVFQKTAYGMQFLKQMFVFAKHASEYQRLRDHHQDLPDDYQIPFADFAKKYHLEDINDFSYLSVPAFGYGQMDHCPAYAIFEYYGTMTLPEVTLAPALKASSFLSIKNGFQGLMEEIASDFNVKFNTVIESIDRSKEGIQIHFKSNNDLYSVSADSLVLAISPLYWPHLGMELTEVEQEVVNNLTYYQYPVAVVKLKGFPAHHYYEYDGLIESGLGHLALITTRDNRENPADGRLCTAYINLPESNTKISANHFVFTVDKIKQLERELLRVSGVTDVEILETKVWQDYMSTLPWKTRLHLDKKQMAQDTKTLYVGPYALGGFEDVACVWEQADKAVDEFLFNKEPPTYDLSYYLQEMHRATFFYTAPKALPFNGKDESKSHRLQN